MAKSYKEKFRDEDGVWRTIGGRRVFIRTGQSLSDAMVESGKFKKKEDKKQEERESISSRYKVYEEENGYSGKGKELLKFIKAEEEDSGVELSSKLKKELESNPNKEYLFDNNKEKLIDKEQQLSDESKETEKVKNNKIPRDFDKITYTQKIETNAGKVGDKFELTKDEYGDYHTKNLRTGETYQANMSMLRSSEAVEFENVKNKKTGYENFEIGNGTNKISGMYNKEKDEVYYTIGREQYKKKISELKDEDFPYTNDGIVKDYITKSDRLKYVEENDKKMMETYEKAKDMGMSNETATKVALNKRIKESGNDYLPKASKVMTAGTSNRKEVSDNIQAHILEYYDNPVDFMEQMDAMDYLPTRWHAGQELAKGGSYAIYYDDQREFLNSLNINPKGKDFSDDRVFEVYTSLIGRESERLYNRLEKLYDQYKKEHKGSNVSLDDFRKWFK